MIKNDAFTSFELLVLDHDADFHSLSLTQRKTLWITLQQSLAITPSSQRDSSLTVPNELENWERFVERVN